jgi:hypothetical protein
MEHRRTHVSLPKHARSAFLSFPEESMHRGMKRFGAVVFAMGSLAVGGCGVEAEAPESVQIEFQELPHEQLPHSPKYQLPRLPTVPRNKR